eukprot:3116833-Heterocapsa_arctica.AAC.1
MGVEHAPELLDGVRLLEGEGDDPPYGVSVGDVDLDLLVVELLVVAAAVLDADVDLRPLLDVVVGERAVVL